MEVQTISDSFPLWLLGRLMNLALEGAHYEASFGGAHMAFLTCIFPIRHSFMVKPIPRLRTAISETTSEGTRRSIDSYNREVEVRKDDSVPDFAVVKATASLHDDCLLLIWELKRDDDDGSQSSIQISRYVRWAVDYQAFILRRDGRLPNVLVGQVEQGQATIYSLTDGLFIQVIQGPVLSEEICGQLRKLAYENRDQ